MTSNGMKYSNIDALHDRSARSVPVGVSDRPSLNQCSWRIWPVAIATKLVSRASDASVS
jgi:hypothetical protein